MFRVLLYVKESLWWAPVASGPYEGRCVILGEGVFSISQGRALARVWLICHWAHY